MGRWWGSKAQKNTKNIVSSYHFSYKKVINSIRYIEFDYIMKRYLSEDKPSMKLCTECIGDKDFSDYIEKNGVKGECDFNKEHGNKNKSLDVESFCKHVDDYFRGKYSIGILHLRDCETMGESYSNIIDNDAFIKVTVSDTGVGLTEEQQENLFNAFRQADTTTARRFGGTGLGLVISKHLVEQMHGEISLESQEGEGSTFWFTFRAEIQNSREELNPLIADRKAQLLVYDSNETVRAAAKNTLSKKNIEVHEYDDIGLVREDILNQGAKQFDAAIIGINAQQPMYLEVSKIFKDNPNDFPIIVKNRVINFPSLGTFSKLPALGKKPNS